MSDPMTWKPRTGEIRRKALTISAVAALGASGALMASTGQARAANPNGDLSFKVVRLAGGDRFATAARTSQQFFGPGVPVAYVAIGTNFPDALAAGPAAAKRGGPVLFVNRDSVPASTRTELDRLNPGTIVVTGGPDVVSAAVLASLATLSSGGATRAFGTDRYDTAVKVSQNAFPAGADVAYVATGTTFPDALSGGAAAGVEGAPMLLTRPTSLPPTVADELNRLNPSRIMLMGGTGAVSADVAAALGAIAPVERISGASRFDTAIAMSKRIFGANRPTAFIATGFNFPDALAAVSPAGRTRGPILLGGGSLTAATSTELGRVSPTTAYLLGGPSVVGVSAAQEAQRLMGVCWSGRKPAAGGQQVISSVPTATKQVSFTLDMGGRLEGARDIVAYLAANQICTTFFPTGAMTQTTEGRAILADIGQRPELFELGNHTMRHCDLVLGGGGSPSAAPCQVSMTGAFIRNELTQTEAILRSASGGMDPRPYWRPPYGSHNTFVRDNAAAVGYTKTLMWNRDTIDWSTSTTTAQIVSRTTSPLPPNGTIVLAHLGGFHTLDALPQIVSTLRSNGYILTTITDMRD
ncbi:N-acetylmuramoyl-L-alanine amidase [Knoellia sinensis KCTC 19936]|uniref:N-acetylmuramoyl-L-alanine amidase n=1 Tax=Knoellia sinensis KCTC 19936 TaxID=1385520 RepID=A0A0A0JF92_9MICO|nr:cell wall-binding repeat-containing protein [Knoellia sinensis]KGN34281.1 N-acetylmuramoyl-L-alanine amidase [Knoellia sinensis KCTC 19936]